MMYLSEKRADAAHLKHEPLNGFELSGDESRKQAPGLPCEIHENGTGFEQGVRLSLGTLLIDDRGNLAVGIERHELRFELIPFADIDRMRFVRQRTFFEHDGDLAAIRRRPRVQIYQDDLRLMVRREARGE